MITEYRKLREGDMSMFGWQTFILRQGAHLDFPHIVPLPCSSCQQQPRTSLPIASLCASSKAWCGFPKHLHVCIAKPRYGCAPLLKGLEGEGRQPGQKTTMCSLCAHYGALSNLLLPHFGFQVTASHVGEACRLLRKSIIHVESEDVA